MMTKCIECNKPLVEPEHWCGNMECTLYHVPPEQANQVYGITNRVLPTISDEMLPPMQRIYCLCGCGGRTKNKSLFISGHDSTLEKKLKLWLSNPSAVSIPDWIMQASYTKIRIHRLRKGGK